ncbi:hypothetical protein ACO22_03548 [Paracoccidioides brasiliensis]|uniref:Thiamine pyrophosphokinase n=1 Tax=Paracoccidioides brasiliensis TaxID=121759 RepID=A0A1D2JFK2_PARBR|nr:hypothetical protein ACO22_03548 [Paracoccidioides brasiliensis]
MDWYPARFFNSPTPPSSPFALLILNQPINEKACKIFKKHASFTICADGGANRFYTLMQRWEKESVELPDAIVGDLDSISPHVRMFYESLHVPVIHDPDQEYTDFTKCLRYIQSRRAAVAAAAAAAAATKDTHNSSPTSSAPAPAPAPAPRTAETHPAFDVLILGGLGGRVDHAFSQIHHLYTSSRHTPPSPATFTYTHGELYLVSEESVTFVLPHGDNRIHIPGGSRMGPSKSTCTTTTTTTTHDTARVSDPERDMPTTTPLAENVGIIPIAGPAVITTHGLEWDVTEWKTEFGGRVSTSNHVREEVVAVSCDGPVLFTVELEARFEGVMG